MSVYDSPTPMTLAARLAEYIADPSTIRVRVLDFYGRAPTIEQCRNLRDAALERKAQETRLLEQKSHDYKMPEVMGCGHPTTDENIDWHGEKLVCVICRKEREDKARKMWAIKAKVRAEVIAEAHYERPTFDAILSPSQRVLKAACHAFRVPHEALIGPSRERYLSTARFAVALVLNEADPLKYSLSVIAGVLRRKDHSTMVHAVKRARDLIARDPAFAAKVEALRDAYATGPHKVPGDVVEALVRRAA